MLHILFSVSIHFVCHFVMFLLFYISRQFCVFIIASKALLFHLEICYKKKPFLALKRLFSFGTRHLTSVQTCVENNMLDRVLINLGTDGTTLITANAKQKEEKIICKSIYMIMKIMMVF